MSCFDEVVGQQRGCGSEQLAHFVQKNVEHTNCL